MARDREKTRTSGVGAALSAAFRAAFRRARGGPAGPPAKASASTRDPGSPLDVAEERAASRDLLAIDSVVRRFYSRSSPSNGADGWERFLALFCEGARIGTVKPEPSSSAGLAGVPVDRFVEVERADPAPSRFAERSRTVHVLGDFAVVISAFEVERGAGGSTGRGVNVLQLRLSPDRGWLIQSVVATSAERTITEKSAVPRPLARRRE